MKMESKVYKSLIKDLNKVKDNEYLKQELENIINEIDNLYSVYLDKILDEDLKIIIANKYIKKIKEKNAKIELNYNLDDVDLLDKEIKIYAKYYKSVEEAEQYFYKEEYSFASLYEANRVLNHITKKNGFAIFLNISATILLFIGFIHAILNTIQNYEFSYFISTIFKYIITSIIMYALAGLFNLLHDIRKKLYTLKF